MVKKWKPSDDVNCCVVAVLEKKIQERVHVQFPAGSVRFPAGSSTTATSANETSTGGGPQGWLDIGRISGSRPAIVRISNTVIFSVINSIPYSNSYSISHLPLHLR